MEDENETPWSPPSCNGPGYKPQKIGKRLEAIREKWAELHPEKEAAFRKR